MAVRKQKQGSHKGKAGRTEVQKTKPCFGMKDGTQEAKSRIPKSRTSKSRTPKSRTSKSRTPKSRIPKMKGKIKGNRKQEVKEYLGDIPGSVPVTFLNPS